MQNIEAAWNYIKFRDIEGLKKLVPSQVSANSSITDDSTDIKYLTHAAAAFGSLECLKYLVDSGADLKLTTPTGYSVIHWAAYGGWVDILEYLNAKKMLMTQTENSDQNALHIASARGHLNCAKYLIDCNLPLDRPAEYKWTPLHFAIAYGHSHIAKYLVERGASTSQVDLLGRSAEVLAREYNRTWWSDIQKRDI